RIGIAALHVFGGNDETEIARAPFHRAQPAVTTGIEIDLACARSDLRFPEVCFECDETRAFAVTVVELSREYASASGGVDRNGRAKLVLRAVDLHAHT